MIIETLDDRTIEVPGHTLVGADLSGADLTDASMAGLRASAATLWPEGFVPPAG